MALGLSSVQKFRLKGDGVDSKTLEDQHECEQSCSMFFFPLEILPLDQQEQLKQLGFANDDLEVKPTRSLLRVQQRLTGATGTHTVRLSWCVAAALYSRD